MIAGQGHQLTGVAGGRRDFGGDDIPTGGEWAGRQAPVAVRVGHRLAQRHFCVDVQGLGEELHDCIGRGRPVEGRLNPISLAGDRAHVDRAIPPIDGGSEVVGRIGGIRIEESGDRDAAERLSRIPGHLGREDGDRERRGNGRRVDDIDLSARRDDGY
jgi:hypothetical protein